MAVDFRCESCGKLLSVEAEPGGTVKCPHCRKKVIVPAALASLPRPQVPTGAAPPGAAAPAPAPTEGELVADAEQGQAVMGVMARLMPWVISVFFHVGLFLILMFMTMFVVVNRVPDDVIVPDAVLSEDPGGRINPGDGSNPNLQASTPKPIDQREFSKHESSIVDAGKTEKQISIIGMGGSASAGGILAQLGPGGGGSGAGPRSNFFGTGGNAHHIVYVIDRSGSMIDTFDFVRHEMLVSISKLKESQDFHIILFAGGPPIENTARRLVPAVKEYKESAAEFLRPIRAEGQTDPVPALMRAFEVLDKADEQKRGKLIYLLTDAAFPDNNKVLSEVSGRNTKKEVLINTYLYGTRPPEAVEVMQKIAKENGGVYKFVSQDE